MPPSSGPSETPLASTASVLIAFFSPEGLPCVLGGAWVGIVCSRPSTLSLTLQRSVERVSWLPAGGSFSVNLPREKVLSSSLFSNLLSSEAGDRLACLGLRLEQGIVTPGPVIAGCPIRIECRQVSSRIHFDQETISGEVLAVQVDEEVHGLNAPVDLCRLQSFLHQAQTAGLTLPRRLAERPVATQ